MYLLMPSLSKSRYLSGDQCHLRLWYDSYERHLAPPPDDTLQAVFDTGHQVGELACERHPGGHSIGHDYRHAREALEETRQVLRAGTAPALFEPAFRHEGVLVRVDILERLPGGGWRLGEVKSTTRLKDVFVLDVAVQLWVLRGAGLDVREVEVITLNRDYVYDGVRLDLDALFRRHPLMDEADALQKTVECWGRGDAGHARGTRRSAGGARRSLLHSLTTARTTRIARGISSGPITASANCPG